MFEFLSIVRLSLEEKSHQSAQPGRQEMFQVSLVLFGQQVRTAHTQQKNDSPDKDVQDRMLSSYLIQMLIVKTKRRA